MNSKKASILLIIMGFLLFPALLIHQNSFDLLGLIDTRNKGNINPTGTLSFTHSQIDNDTTPPSISYIQPSINNTVITIHTYNIIVEIVDENSPISGNVIAELSNLTSFLFNVSMDS